MRIYRLGFVAILLAAVTFGNWSCSGPGDPAAPNPTADQLFTSTDNGKSWKSTASERERIDDLEIMQNNLVIEMGKDAVGIKGGSYSPGVTWNWETILSFPTGISLFDLEAQKRNMLWVASTSKLLNVQSDLMNGAVAWNEHPMSGMGEISYLKFLTTDDNFGLCAQANPTDARSLAYTTNAGETWTLSAFDRKINDVDLISENNYVIASDEGFFQSTDHGESWGRTNLLELSMTEFDAESSIGFGIDRSQSELYKTTDFGVNWERVPFSILPAPGVGAVNRMVIANAGDGVWLLLERDVLYSNDKVDGYNYYIRRLTGNGANMSERYPVYVGSKTLYDYNLIRVNQNNKNEVCVVLR